MPALERTSAPASARHPIAARIGTGLVAVPLVLGVLAALAALSGRLGGPENALTALWYVPMASAAIAIPGAAALVWAAWGGRRLRQIVLASLAAAGGWAVSQLWAQASGIAETSDVGGPAFAVMWMLVAVFFLGMIALVLVGVRLSGDQAHSVRG